MRDIRFRGFSISIKKWVYGYLWIVPGVNLYYILTGKINKDCSIEKYEVYPESIGQFTGLKDKNSVEIYEGDIVSDGINNYIVAFYKDAWRLKRNVDGDTWWKSLYRYATSCEIIGNIYRNKELLGGK